VVGQIASGYILADEPLAAWILVQHVAHERALLDRLADPEDGPTPTVQLLLVPEVVQLAAGDAAEAADSLECVNGPAPSARTAQLSIMRAKATTCRPATSMTYSSV
jgi:DNA mismatch repair ATPase MutL